MLDSTPKATATTHERLTASLMRLTHRLRGGSTKNAPKELGSLNVSRLMSQCFDLSFFNRRIALFNSATCEY